MRAADRVGGLILINSSARGTTPGERALNLQRVELAQRAKFTGLSRDAIERVLAPSRRKDAEMVARIRSMSGSLGKDVFIRQLGIVREDGLEECGRIHCPTLVIASEDDQFRLSEESSEMAAAIPGATLKVLSDCGHMAPLEAPDRLSEIVVPWLAAR